MSVGGPERRKAFPGRLCAHLASSERVSGGLRALAMALHVPKAPGFAQMLKDGAKVGDGEGAAAERGRRLLAAPAAGLRA